MLVCNKKRGSETRYNFKPKVTKLYSKKTILRQKCCLKDAARCTVVTRPLEPGAAGALASAAARSGGATLGLGDAVSCEL